MVNEQNPLSEFFRGTPIFVKLPSCGFYSKEGTIKTSVSGDIEVYPMTTADELLFKSPDALINGESIAKVIQSCAPSIIDVFDVPMNDIEVLLLAIRKVTYGDQIDFSSMCPECKTPMDFGLSLDLLLSDIDVLEPNEHVNLDNGLMIKIKPYTYKSSVKAAILTFNEGRFLQMLIEEDLTDEEKAEKATTSYKKAIELTIELLSSSIVSVSKDDELITDDPKFLREWLEKSSRNDTKKIEEKIKQMNTTGIKKEKELECNNCNNVWKSTIEFDPSHFFDPSS